MMLTILVDRRRDASVHLIGYELPAGIQWDSNTAGSSNAPLLAHLLINTETNIICILPSANQDASCYDGRHRLRMTPPCRWERADGHYAIMDVNPFADRLYRHMGWDRALSFIIPAIPVPGDCVISDLDARCGTGASGDPEPLFFDLNAAISPDASLSASTTPCQGTMLLEV